MGHHRAVGAGVGQAQVGGPGGVDVAGEDHHVVHVVIGDALEEPAAGGRVAVPLIDVEDHVADLQGLKFRISGSKIADRYFRDLGAIPQIMAFSEVYQALQTGVVDGCENTPSNYLTQKFYEVQKDITVSNHAHLQYAVIVNTKFWNGLPPDIRKELEKAMGEATDYTNSIAMQENKDALEKIKASGKTTLHYLTDDQRKAWQTAMRPTYAWAKSRVGQEIIDILGQELNIKMN